MIRSLSDDRAERSIVPRSGRGCYLETETGETYLDYRLGGGSLVAGHAHPRVVAAVRRQAERGTTFDPRDRAAGELARRIVAAVPCAEDLEFTSTGTEATMLSIRLARAYTGRSTILKFAGAYHGWHDAVLRSTHKAKPSAFADVTAPAGTVDSAGVPNAADGHTVVAPFNDLTRTRAIVDEYADDLAAIIVEPVMRSIPPVDGFLDGLRRLCDETGVVLIFDEVATGFRLARGGAQEYYGVEPDLATYGKVIGGGTPLGAVCGSDSLLRGLRVDGTARRVVAGGTLRHNAIGAAAGVATLDVLDRPGTYRRLRAYADELRRTIEDVLADASVPGIALGAGPMLDYVVTDAPAVERWETVLSADAEIKRAVDRAVVDDGVLTKVGVGKRYVSVAHGDAEFDRTAEAFKRAVECVA